ncbi:MAG TPA: hypothetical protein VMJ65_25875 [Solirubrobacteraceae bacterium]|nr:hypothetical protein [Solirubrobacteraceae bacterium]
MAITGGGLTLGNPTIHVIGERPTQLEVSVSVTDARGTRRMVPVGRRLRAERLGRSEPDRDQRPFGLRIGIRVHSRGQRHPRSARGERERPTLTGVEAEPGSGLGAQAVELFITVPPGVRDPLNLSFSVSTQPTGPSALSSPAPSAGLGPQLPPCSLREMTTTNTCRTKP